PMAHGGIPLAQGMDRSQRGGRETHRGILALTPGADVGDAREPGARALARTVDEELSTGGALRRDRPAERRSGGAGTSRLAPHERHPARQWRAPAERPDAAAFQGLRG